MPQRSQTPLRKDAFLTLVECELKNSQDISAFGVLKWLLDPLAYMGMYFLLVGVMLQRSEFAYPIFILCAVLPWRYVQGVISSGMVLIDSYSRVLVTRNLPRGILPLVVVVTEGVSFVIGLVLLAPIMAYYRIGPSKALLWLPLVMLVLAVVVSGPAYLATLLGLYFPDYRAFSQSVTRIGFLASTALVPLKKVPGDRLPRLIGANPMSGVFDAFRDIFLQARAPQLTHLAYPTVFGLLLAVLGAALYRWREPQFAKEV